MYIIVCDDGSIRINTWRFCKVWFDYEKGCHDKTCDGPTRMSLRPETVKWVVEMGRPATTSIFCTMEPAWPIYLTNHKAFNVQLMCQQICDYCPSHILTASTTTTKITSRITSTTISTTSHSITTSTTKVSTTVTDCCTIFAIATGKTDL